MFDRPQHFGAGTNCRCYLLVQRARCCLQTGLRKYFDRSSNETTAAAGVILKWAWNSDLCVSDLKQALIFRVGEGWPSSELMASSRQIRLVEVASCSLGLVFPEASDDPSSVLEVIEAETVNTFCGNSLHLI